MDRFVIEGGHPLRGEITASGNKNAALKMLPACLLTSEPVILRNVPDIADVRITAEIMRDLGVEITEIEPPPGSCMPARFAPRASRRTKPAKSGAAS
jgi:UDP-N-acetylglucosamine 1-carboxyvinyltransferase